MSEIFQLSETGVIDVIFAKSGIPSTVTPAPTFELRRVSDNALMDSGTLTAVGNAYPYTITQAGGALYRLTATTTDATADYPTFIEEARIGQTWLQFLNASLSGIPAAVWDALTTTLTTANSVGKRLVDFMTTLVYSTPPTAAQNAVAVVDQTLSGHTTTGTVGGQLNAISPSADPLANPLPGSYAAGTAGADIYATFAKVQSLNAANITVLSSTSQSGDITVTQGTTVTVTLTFSAVTANPAGGTFELTVYNPATADVVADSPYLGALVSYDSVAGTAVVTWAFDNAQTAAFDAPNTQPLKNDYFYEAKIVYPTSMDAIVPITVRNGRFTVNYSPTANP